MKMQKTRTVGVHPYANPLSTRRLAVGVSLLDDAKCQLALAGSFGVSFTAGPIYQVPRAMLDLPGVIASEVAFNAFGMLDVLVVKVSEDAYSEILNELLAAMMDHAAIEEGCAKFDLGTLVILVEKAGYGRSPCITYMTPAFEKAREDVRLSESIQDCVA